MKSYIKPLLSFFSIILLIYFNKLTVSGCLNGIKLCIKCVIPSMFPVMVVTSYIIKKNYCAYISKLLHPIFKILFNCSANCSFPIFIGLVCGCPISAKTIKELYLNKSISDSESYVLSTFCCNCSMSFVINYAYYFVFKENMSILKYIFLIYAPTILCGIINFRIVNPTKSKSLFVSKQDKSNFIFDSVKSMSLICCYVILFSSIIQIIKQFITSQLILIPCINLIEITTGLANSTGLYYKITLAFLIFGGLSIMFQSFAFLNNKQKMYYILGKLEQIIIYLLLNITIEILV